jgi:hypothetical protein
VPLNEIQTRIEGALTRAEKKPVPEHARSYIQTVTNSLATLFEDSTQFNSRAMI